MRPPFPLTLVAAIFVVKNVLELERSIYTVVTPRNDFLNIYIYIFLWRIDFWFDLRFFQRDFVVLAELSHVSRFS